jgi:hypothetical protein
MVVVANEKLKKWTDTNGIAEHTGMSAQWFHRDRVTKLVGVPFVRFGRKIMYHTDIVDEFFLSRTVRPNDARGE